MTYMKALAAAEDGFYPLGANGMWHGGVHFDQNTAKHLKQDAGIRVIADGEVVAYRLDSKYPEQDYPDVRAVGLAGLRIDRQQQHHADRYAQALHPCHRAVPGR
ncbi:hypothetical protein [Burkholderia sp. Tr-860]|nr:hypothetical protein [Burkholderia sp. Tr-860]